MNPIAPFHRPSLLPTLLVAVLSACASPSLPDLVPRDGETDVAWAAPDLARVVSVRDGRTDADLSLDELCARLAASDVVFLGETHTDETTHRVQLAVYEALLELRKGRVVLALEMFERDAQPVLDDYLAGRIDEAAFLAAARPWSNYATAYRPLIERAKAGGHPVVASNFPRPLRNRLAMLPEAQKAETLANLPKHERRLAPSELHANTSAYHRRVDNAIRGHLEMMRSFRSGDDDQRLYSTQTLWDNSMGEACARALSERPGHLVLHVNGGFHSAYWDGTVRQLALRQPGASVATVDIAPTTSPFAQRSLGEPRADYVVYAESRASDISDGAWSVSAPRKLEYRVHVPPSATADARVPLLVFFPDDGLTAEDGLELWKSRLGEEAALAVFEAPYREVLPDLSEGGRWFFADSFRADLGHLTSAVSRAWGYLLRHHPVDPDRVVYAGEGTGATVVAALAILDDFTPFRSVSLAPRRYAKIKDYPLPLPELRGERPAPERTLQLLLRSDADEDWWKKELEEYANVGLSGVASRATTDAWRRESEREDLLRDALGLSAENREEITERRHVSLDVDSSRARHWARLFAMDASDGGRAVAVLEEGTLVDGSQPLELEVDLAALRTGERLPLCPGSFGGTTVVVLPASTPADELDAWVALEQDDPLTKRSRFHRLRVATEDGRRPLRDVLTKLRDRGRTNVLVVPAAFCVSGDRMRALERGVRDLADNLTLHWSPGLGASSADRSVR